ncbi:hypothetical protein [Christiangramia portivictoriae]|uniref:hypothetical protein n=1 Tax=Christiangramia portivictoriae TaxID=326069 RepID=UPI000429630E|nr:hypothetical protein [Christiangramia portivictoriae]
MKTKFVVLIMLFFTVSSMHAQEQKSDLKKPYAVTELKFQTKKFKELTEFEWSSLDSIFINNSPDTEIDLIFEINRKLRLNTTEVDNIKFVVSGKTSELDSLKIRAQKLILKLQENLH